MKSLFLIVFWSVACLANAKEKGVNLGYVVLSDVLDASIPKNNFVVEATFFEYDTKKVLTKISFQAENDKSNFCESGKLKYHFNINSSYISFGKAGFQTTYFEKYDIKAQHRIKLKVYLEKEGLNDQIILEKPVIYVYSDSALDFEIKLKTKGELLFSYPVLDKNQTWKMQIDSNNNLRNVKGEGFPYLFWESSQIKNWKVFEQDGTIQGEIVAKENVISFLEEKLSTLGLNSHEKVDFITFWGPRLMQKRYSFVQFSLQEDNNKFSEMEISPVPNQVNRVFILFTSFDDKNSVENIFTTNLKPQTLPRFNRAGFDVLEWGGMEFALELMLKSL